MNKKSNSNKNICSKGKLQEGITVIFLCMAIQAAMLTGACILSLIIGIKSDNYYIPAIAAICVGSAFSGFTVVRRIRKNGMINGILYALPSNIIFILFSLISNSFKADYMLILSFLLLVVSSGIGGVLSVNFVPKTKIKAKR